ncbi:MAG: alpha/beta hydrolase [Ornithinimicrobium sp.]
MNPARGATHKRGWLRIILGVAWLGVAAWSWLTRGETLLAGHPAQAVALVIAALVGLLLVIWGARGPRAQGPRDRRRWLRVTGAVLGVLVSVTLLSALVFLRPFSATPDAIDAMSGSVEVKVADSATRITLSPGGDGESPTSVGMVFQPGARVDPRAYVPLLSEIAATGHLVVIIKQPFNIGFTAINAPSEIIEDHPEIAHWALAGHSLGGVAGSSYAADTQGQVDAVLFWASYPLGSLADSDLAVTSISGSNDGLSTPADIEESRKNLPPDTTFVQVDGAVHAFFGDYGPQAGDGEPAVSRASAQRQIVEASITALAALTP